MSNQTLERVTPGKWEAAQGGDNLLRVYAGKKVICQFGEGIDEELTEHDNARANARLIAAAPELLEAAVKAEKLINEIWSEFGLLYENQETLRELRQAISKATNEIGK